MRKTTKELFDYKYKKNDRTGCWEWTAAVSKSNGYGRFGINMIMMGAHRASWIINVGPIPKDLCVLHKCDNRLCVNPDHLFLGTNLDNTRDAIIKGRVHKKLTDEQINIAYQKHALGSTKLALSKEFKVCYITMCKYLRYDNLENRK